MMVLEKNQERIHKSIETAMLGPYEVIVASGKEVEGLLLQFAGESGDVSMV